MYGNWNTLICTIFVNEIILDDNLIVISKNCSVAFIKVNVTNNIPAKYACYTKSPFTCDKIHKTHLKVKLMKITIRHTSDSVLVPIKYWKSY